MLGIDDRWLTKCLSHLKYILPHNENSESRVISLLVGWDVIAYSFYADGSKFSLKCLGVTLFFKEANNVPMLHFHYVIVKEFARFFFRLRHKNRRRILAALCIKHSPDAIFPVQTINIATVAINGKVGFAAAFSKQLFNKLR